MSFASFEPALQQIVFRSKGTLEIPWDEVDDQEKAQLLETLQWDIDYFSVFGTLSSLLENPSIESLLTGLSGKILRKTFTRSLYSKKYSKLKVFAIVGAYYIGEPILRRDEEEESIELEAENSACRILDEDNEEGHNDKNIDFLLDTKLSKCIPGNNAYKFMKISLLKELGDLKVCLKRNGQKDCSVETFYSTLQALTSFFDVEIALALEINKEHNYLAVKADSFSPSSLYPLFLSARAVNVYGCKSIPSIHNSYKYSIYNTSQHIRKHCNYTINFSCKERNYKEAIQKSVQKNLNFIKEQICNSNIHYQSLRFEVYFYQLKDMDLSVMKDEMVTFMKKNVGLMRAETRTVNSFFEILCETTEVLYENISFTNYSEIFLFFEILHQLFLACYSGVKLNSKEFMQCRSFGLDKNVFQSNFIKLSDIFIENFKFESLVKRFSFFGNGNEKFHALHAIYIIVEMYSIGVKDVCVKKTFEFSSHLVSTTLNSTIRKCKETAKGTVHLSFHEFIEKYSAVTKSVFGHVFSKQLLRLHAKSEEAFNILTHRSHESSFSVNSGQSKFVYDCTRSFSIRGLCNSNPQINDCIDDVYINEFLRDKRHIINDAYKDAGLLLQKSGYPCNDILVEDDIFFRIFLMKIPVISKDPLSKFVSQEWPIPSFFPNLNRFVQFIGLVLAINCAIKLQNGMSLPKTIENRASALSRIIKTLYIDIERISSIIFYLDIFVSDQSDYKSSRIRFIKLKCIDQRKQFRLNGISEETEFIDSSYSFNDSIAEKYSLLRQLKIAQGVKETLYKDSETVSPLMQLVS